MLYAAQHKQEVGTANMATLAQASARGLSFWQKMALGIAVFIVFAFGQFAARGFVDYGAAPVWLHVHGAVMVSWLALLVAQPTLIASGNAALHRKLGWLGVALAALVVGMGSFTAISTIAIGREPPFLTPPLFLALTHVGLVIFAGVVTGAIALRRDQAWHQRLMIGSAILLMEPALGRVVPMPLIVPWSETVVLFFQLCVAWLIARHDRRELGAVHPATRVVIAAVVAHHLAFEALGRTALFAQWAQQIAAG